MLSAYCEGMDNRIQNRNIQKINYAARLHADQQAKVEREKYIEALLLSDWVNTVKACVTRYDYFRGFKEAVVEIPFKKKSERPNLEMLKSFLGEDFFPDEMIKPIKITQIIQQGYEAYGYDVRLNYNGIDFYINIPQKNFLTVENFEYAHRGMYSFGIIPRPNYLKEIASSYREVDIKNAIIEYFKNDY